MKKNIVLFALLLALVFYLCHVFFRSAHVKNEGVIKPTAFSNTPVINGALSNPPAAAGFQSSTNDLLMVEFPDGSGKHVVADKENSTLMVLDKAGIILWKVNMAAKYELARQSIFSLEIDKSNGFVAVVATPGASSFFFNRDTGEFLGAQFMHQPQ